MVDTDQIAVGDFVDAPADAPIPEAVYRVVGTSGDALVCLRVTDGSGRRTSTGELVRVDAPMAASLQSTSEPRRSLGGLVKNVVEGPYWMVRSLL